MSEHQGEIHRQIWLSEWRRFKGSNEFERSLRLMDWMTWYNGTFEAASYNCRSTTL